jgi:hypothetical protein
VEFAECGVAKYFATLGTGTLRCWLQAKAVNFDVLSRIGRVVEYFEANLALGTPSFYLKKIKNI